MDLDALELLATESEALFLEPRECFDAALIGLAERADGTVLLAYSIPKLVDAVVQQHGMSREDAREWLEFNTLQAWVGAGTPVFIEPLQAPKKKGPS